MIPTPILEMIAAWHLGGQTIVLVTGVFDLLHTEHIVFLQRAKRAGDVLCVAIESDARVLRLKGPGRPVWDQERRKDALTAAGIADAVWILPELFDTPVHHEHLIAQIRPAVFAVSSHSPHQDRKREIVEKHGGKLCVVHQHNPNLSTTQLIAQMKGITDH